MPIIISKKGKNAIRLEKTSFKQEEELQKYIYNNPESIPLEEIKEDVQFLVVDKEFPVSVGSIDVLEVDIEGDIYILETKLYKNPDKRFVLAQVLDYGASLWRFYADPDDFVQKLDERVRDKTGKGLVEKLENNFGKKSSEIIESIKQNLLDGTFKFVILMDKVSSNLKDLVLFMNQNSQFSIYLVELDYYTHKGYEILIPHLFGAESKKKIVSASERKKWDEESFFNAAKMTPEAYDAIKKLYDFSQKKSDEITWGTGAATGSFNPKFRSISDRSIYTVWSDGSLTLNFGWLYDTENTLQWRERLRDKLKGIKSISAYIPESLENKYPILPAKAWTPVIDDFINILIKLLKEK